jgi:nuclear pore complex protein Nup155
VSTLLESLAEAIISAGAEVASDESITRFFTSYGYREGCAMCLALVVGCGPASVNSAFGTNVQRKAMEAVFGRALKPQLILRPDDQNGSAQTVIRSVASSSDSLVPLGYEFRPSALSEGLTSLVARLLRPIWHKPAVVVTEGPCVRRQWSMGTRLTPAKVELLLDEVVIEEISRPLRYLLVLMKENLSPAIKKVPGVPKSMDMEIDSENNEKPPFTQALQYRSQLQAGQSGATAQLSGAETTRITQLIEEKDIHSLFRLLARVVQLLDLITFLRHSYGSTELREVDWGLLHGLTIAQLVQTSEGQDRLEGLLNAVVTSSASDSSISSNLSAQADDLAKMFAEHCYLFFSPGSRYAYFGLRQASRAMMCHPSSSERTNLAGQAAEYFRQAGLHWHSAPLISGRIIHKKGKETYSETALRAIRHGSPLASAVGALIQLGDLASAVEICLAVAANFKSGGGKRAIPSDALGGADAYELGWEKNLYHKRRDPGDVANAGSIDTVGRLPGNSSSSPIVAYGAEVTAQDAVDTCYGLVFHHQSLLLKSTNQYLAMNMVRECAGVVDIEFLSAYFLFLLESDNADMLLKVDSPEVEKWLIDRKDDDLLWRYYSIQGKHRDACEVLFGTASDSTTNTMLSVRIECLSKALNSIKTAFIEEQRTARFGGEASGELVQRIKVVEDHLQVARIQSRILHVVDTQGSSLPPEVTGELLERLRTSLVPVSDLYNNYAAVLELHELCLQIVQVCSSNDVEGIIILWKHIFRKEILPCTTRRDVSYSFLQRFVRDIGHEYEVHRPGIEAGLPVFEDGDWAKRLEGKLVALGKELYGKGADYVFPLDFLLFHLEGKCVVSFVFQCCIFLKVS